MTAQYRVGKSGGSRGGGFPDKYFHLLFEALKGEILVIFNAFVQGQKTKPNSGPTLNICSSKTLKTISQVPCNITSPVAEAKQTIFSVNSTLVAKMSMKSGEFILWAFILDENLTFWVKEWRHLVVISLMT